MEAILDWTRRQPWARQPDVLPPAETDLLDVPVDELAAFSERVRMDFGYRFAFAGEPDGSYSWAVLTEECDVIHSGVADSWDDAKLAAIENLYPPSDEGR